MNELKINEKIKAPQYPQEAYNNLIALKDKGKLSNEDKYSVYLSSQYLSHNLSLFNKKQIEDLFSLPYLQHIKNNKFYHNLKQFIFENKTSISNLPKAAFNTMINLEKSVYIEYANQSNQLSHIKSLSHLPKDLILNLLKTNKANPVFCEVFQNIYPETILYNPHISYKESMEWFEKNTQDKHDKEKLWGYIFSYSEIIKNSSFKQAFLDYFKEDILDLMNNSIQTNGKNGSQLTIAKFMFTLGEYFFHFGEKEDPKLFRQFLSLSKYDSEKEYQCNFLQKYIGAFIDLIPLTQLTEILKPHLPILLESIQENIHGYMKETSFFEYSLRNEAFSNFYILRDFLPQLDKDINDMNKVVAIHIFSKPAFYFNSNGEIHLNNSSSWVNETFEKCSVKELKYLSSVVSLDDKKHSYIQTLILEKELPEKETTKRLKI